jgi:WD40 repeat protein
LAAGLGKDGVAPTNYARIVPIWALAFHPKARALAVGGYHEVLIYDPSTGTLLRRVSPVARQVQSLAFSPDGEILAVAAGTPGRAGEVRLFEAQSGHLRRTLATAGDLLIAVTFSPDGRSVATGGADNAVRVFDLLTGALRFRSEQNADWIMDLAFSSDGKKIVSASRDKTARVLDASNGELDQTYAGHNQAVFTGAFSPDGARAITAGRDREMHLWQVAEGKKIAESRTFSGEILHLVLLGDRIIGGLENGEIVEARLGEKKVEFIRTWGWHADGVGALAVDPASDVLATGGLDGRIKIWDLKTGEVRAEFAGRPGREEPPGGR